MAECSTPWSTTNSVYGASFSGAMTARLPGVERRPPGVELGAGRPFPALNQEQLSPRVPQKWALESGISPRSVGRDKLLSSVQGKPIDMSRLAPSSQRDAARGYAMMLGTVSGGSTALRPHARPTSSCDAWWSVGRVAEVGPRYYGA